MSEPSAAEAPDPDGRRAAFVSAMRLVPGAVAVIATGVGEARTGLAATAWTSLSADPPTLLACINRRASAFAAIRRTGAFSVNLLAADQTETAAIFSAQRGLDGGRRFLPGAWAAGRAGQPVFLEALATFECRLRDVHEYASHGMFVGEVLEVARGRSAAAALLYADGRFTAIGGGEGTPG